MLCMSNTTPADTLLLTVHDAATHIGVSPNTLRTWRHENRGPASFKRAGRVVYRRSDLYAWQAAQEAATTRGGTP